ncbi:MAG: monovalent cation/H+ antiporter subunit D family protein [bacterium]|nr:monovalent cation/H+ antiporter subunit D family protein [bacterium]
MNIAAQLPVIVLVLPLLSAFAVTLVSLFNKKLAWPLTVLTMTATFLATTGTLCSVIHNGAIRYRVANWAPPFGIELVIDHLSALVAVVISIVALLVAIFAKETIQKDIPNRVGQFYTLFILCTVGLLGETLTGDAFNLYVLIEITSLTSYALLAFGGSRAYFSTFNYLILGTIGACLYLLGVGYLYIKTGSLNMIDIATLIPALSGSSAIFTAFILILVGLWIKMAFFPFHGWLPNAYTHATSTVSAFAAPLMTKVTVYMSIRLMYFVFGPDYAFSQFTGPVNIVWLAVIAILVGSYYALVQTDIKRMLTYIIIAEVGYMVGGMWLGNAIGLTGTIYHIAADAIMTACLFLALGSIAYKLGSTKISDMAGIFKKMPVTFCAFLVGAAGMIGIPPTAGFFSKWFLISGGIQAGQWAFVVALLVSSLVNAILFFRIIEVGFFGADDEDEHDAVVVQRNEAPLSMLLPTVTAAALVILLGLSTSKVTSLLIENIVGSLF